MDVSRTIARAQQETFDPTKVGLLIAGEEVPHVHVHLIPFTRLHQLDLAHADHDPDPAALDAAADRLRQTLRAHGAPGVTDS
jgi:histidine triad (HIT) family protein